MFFPVFISIWTEALFWVWAFFCSFYADKASDSRQPYFMQSLWEETVFASQYVWIKCSMYTAVLRKLIVRVCVKKTPLHLLKGLNKITLSLGKKEYR